MPLGTSTPWAVDHGRITPHIVKAVQDIAGISSTFKANLTLWLGSAENGIVDLFAKNIYATNVTVDHGYFGIFGVRGRVRARGKWSPHLEVPVNKQEPLLRCKPIYTAWDRITSMLWGVAGGTATAAFVGWLTGAPWLTERLSQMIELVLFSRSGPLRGYRGAME